MVLVVFLLSLRFSPESKDSHYSLVTDEIS